MYIYYIYMYIYYIYICNIYIYIIYMDIYIYIYSVMAIQINDKNGPQKIILWICKTTFTCLD